MQKEMHIKHFNVISTKPEHFIIQNLGNFELSVMKTSSEKYWRISRNLTLSAQNYKNKNELYIASCLRTFKLSQENVPGGKFRAFFLHSLLFWENCLPDVDQREKVEILILRNCIMLHLECNLFSTLFKKVEVKIFSDPPNWPPEILFTTTWTFSPQSVT